MLPNVCLDKAIEPSEHTMSLHDAQELDDDLRTRSDENLALSGFLGVVDGVERIVQDAGFDHVVGGMRFSTRAREVRYLRCGEERHVSNQES